MRRYCFAGRVAIGHPANNAATKRILIERAAYKFGIVLVKRLRRVMQLAVNGAKRSQHLRLGRLVAIGAHNLWHGCVDGNAPDAGQDYNHHQHISQRVHVPAKLEPGVQRPNNNQAKPKIGMRRCPCL